MEHMINLLHDQKLLLAAYQLFYGKRYTSNCKEKAMQMVYLLQRAGIDIGGFSFSFNSYPYSPGLLLLIRQLDRKELEIDMFYNNATIKDSVIGKYRNKILEIRGALSILEHSADSLSWVILLSTMAYVAHSVLPGAGFELICDNVNEKLHTNYQEDIMRSAWNALSNVNLLL